jgi:hypothetical protein
MKRSTALHIGVMVGIVFGHVSAILRIRYQVSLDDARWIQDVNATQSIAVVIGVGLFLVAFVVQSYAVSRAIETDRVESVRQLHDLAKDAASLETAVNATARKVSSNLEETLYEMRNVQAALDTSRAAQEVTRLARPDTPITTKKNGNRALEHQRAADSIRAKAVFTNDMYPYGAPATMANVQDLSTTPDEPTTLYSLPPPSSPRPESTPISPKPSEVPRSPLRGIVGLSLQPVSPRQGIIVPVPGLTSMPTDEDTPTSRRLGATLPGMPVSESPPLSSPRKRG